MVRQAHKPCPDCGSSDALLINEDGSTKCFSCGKFTPVNDETLCTTNNIYDIEFLKGKATPLPSRKILQETCKRYKYMTSTFNGRSCEIATYRDLKGNPVFQKVRFTDEKGFLIIGKYKPILYGMHLFSGQTKKLIITEGEIDCLSVSQVVKGYPVVSVPLGAGNAKASIKENLQWIESFEEVVLCFDMDEAGEKAIKECAPLISIGKCKIMKLPLKDPNEMLKAGQEADLYKATWNGITYRPDGIVSKEELWGEVQKPVEYGLSYPWEGLTKLTYGIRKSEIVVFGAGTGMGKTEFFKEIEHHLINTHKKKVGIIHLEEIARDTALGLMAKHCGIKFHVPDAKYSKQVFKKAFDEVIGSDLPVIYNGYGTTDFDVIENIIRYMAKGCDCEYIFFDHITAMADGVSSTTDVNQRMRNVVSKLASLTRELNIGLFIISHLRKTEGKLPHEEGGRVHLDDLYGAAALKQWISFAFGLERNQQSEDEDVRHTTTLRCLKDRYTGLATGKTISIKYEKDTGLLKEVSETFKEKTEQVDEELF